MRLIRLLSLTIFAGLFIAQAQAENRTISLASINYAPYYASTLENNGVISEIIATAFKRVGYNVKVEFLPFSRGKSMTKNGKFDGMFTLWYRKERLKYFLFSDPVPLPQEIVLYKRKDLNISFKTFDDISDLSIGYVFGYNYPKEFVQAEVRKTKSYTDDENIMKLIKGKVDLAITDRLQAMWAINNSGMVAPETFEAIMPALQTDQQYLVISKKISDFKSIGAAFNKGLKQITEDGTVAKIKKRHGF